MIRFIGTVCVAICFAPLQASIADSLNIYTHRQPVLLEPILEAYTKKQGSRFQLFMRQKDLFSGFNLREMQLQQIWLSQLI